MRYFDALTGGKLEQAPAGAMRVEGEETAVMVGPALFDPQINGYAGVDFQSPDVSMEELEHAALALRAGGCSHFLITLITNEAGALVDQFARLTDMVERSAVAREMVLGYHLEGPFIAEQKGYIGAHPPQHAINPDWEMFSRFQKAAGGKIKLLTLAPECPGAPAFIRRAVASGVWISGGHCNPTLEQLWAAVEAGARLFTHLGNGCPVELPRHDNIIQRVLSVPDLMVLLIPDLIHVPVPAIGNLARALGTSRIVLTTDAAAPAGATPGTYYLGSVEVEVGEDRVVRLPGSMNLAGSALTPVEGLYNMARYGGLSLAESWRAWTRLRRMMFPEVEAPPLALAIPSPTPCVEPMRATKR